MSKDTVLVTGGGSGIGRRLAEELQKRGNQVVIAGRRQDVLEAACAANPGMQSIVLDVSDPAAVKRFAGEVVARFPALNFLINNAGMLASEDLTADPVDLNVAERTIVTNLLGPIRLTAALLPHLQRQPRAKIVNVSSGLGFVPLASAPTYSATKAALHSYTLSLRHQLRDTNVTVTEIIPPYVQTTLVSEEQAVDPAAMPLEDFIAETMRNFDAEPDAPENCVQAATFPRNAEREGRFEAAFGAVNSMFH